MKEAKEAKKGSIETEKVQRDSLAILKRMYSFYRAVDGVSVAIKLVGEWLETNRGFSSSPQTKLILAE